MPKKISEKYTMRIERTIVDNLGVKLYDKVAAVVAELIANSYDADAENVLVEVPLGKALATHRGGKVVQAGYEVRITDDGHGMTPEEADECYLSVGRLRREHLNQGNTSRKKKRPVMGRKGLGKLAPFGVCATIEVRSAGGEKTEKGYRVTHFQLEYEGIARESTQKDRDYHPKPLADDETWDSTPGTVVVLKDFLTKRVPDAETFGRQLSYRFGLGSTDFSILVRDNKENPEPEFPISEVDIPLMDGTRIDVSSHPVQTDDDDTLPVTGWVGMSVKSYKNEELAGVRIYVRGKIAALTRDFGAPAGFTGEYVARSYLVGAIHADWLDEQDDLIQTHRQDILWSSELGQALTKWGQEIIKKVARAGAKTRRKLVGETFLQKSDLKVKAHERYKDPELEKTVLELGEKIGQFASEEEIQDEEYVEGLTEIILTVAPHKLLVDVFRKIQEMAEGGKIDVNELVKLFQTANIAQLASYGQIVSEKIKAIDTFEKTIRQNVDERTLQELLEDAPWLIDGRWEPITANQQFKMFRSAFEAWYEKKYSKKITTTASSKDKKKPDFIFLHADNQVKVVEIKPPDHAFNNEDWKRMNAYDDAMEEFFSAHEQYKKDFPDGFGIILIVDDVNIKDSTSKKAFASLMDKNKLEKKTWEELLRDTKQFHKNFLEARDTFPNNLGESDTE